ncbi:hypothetical protein HGM15179_011047 [Zosterops borbonicus]|uniref:Uncharacterized protein n=1 Tax=Zosterops borbonicus TaxID=364589 RepID=A0A8K1LJ57_9PASS|nr:hypothetical protein HGM15179_011047 [Zosterops borbonicus]
MLKNRDKENLSLTKLVLCQVDCCEKCAFLCFGAALSHKLCALLKGVSWTGSQEMGSHESPPQPSPGYGLVQLTSPSDSGEEQLMVLLGEGLCSECICVCQGVSWPGSGVGPQNKGSCVCNASIRVRKVTLWIEQVITLDIPIIPTMRAYGK